MAGGRKEKGALFLASSSHQCCFHGNKEGSRYPSIPDVGTSHAPKYQRYQQQLDFSGFTLSHLGPTPPGAFEHLQGSPLLAGQLSLDDSDVGFFHLLALPFLRALDGENGNQHLFLDWSHHSNDATTFLVRTSHMMSLLEANRERLGKRVPD